MKAVRILEKTNEGHRVINYVYVQDGSVVNQVVHLTHVNDDLERILKEGIFNPSPSVSKHISASSDPELFLSSLSMRYNGSSFYWATAPEEVEIENMRRVA
ncbi:MAG: hypothetical protein BM556_17020 [Bacteriovorax sp. MedPE-SWde]|nr:MAG: hypothetical protein BM556_17020 [Bacteriovorax sp. MedPE-SWde]